MKNKNYIQNIRTLINSNLLFLDLLNKNGNLTKQNPSKPLFTYLSVLEYIKNIKQLIRLLQFLRNQRVSILYLESNNKIFEEILNSIKKKNSKIFLRFFNLFLFKPKWLKDIEKFPKLYIYANQNSFTNNYFKFLFLNKFYIVNSVNSNYDKTNLGFYKFHNNLTEIKKIFFFLLILKKNI